MPDAPADRVAQLRALIARMPEDETLRFILGRHLAEAGASEEAIAEFEAALSLKPGFTAVYLALGKTLQKAGRLDDARKVYEDGLRVAEETKDEMTRKAMESLLRNLD